MQYKKPDRAGGKPGQAVGSILVLFHYNIITTGTCNSLKMCAILCNAITDSFFYHHH